MRTLAATRRIVGLAFAFAVLALLGACASNIDPKVAGLHVIAVDPEGRPVDPCSNDTLHRAAFLGQIERMLDEADAESDRRELRSTAPCPNPRHRHPDGAMRRVRRILIHVHGGMNTRSASLDTARAVIPEMRKETGEDWSYPIFLSWLSGPIDSYDEHVRLLRNGEHYPVWGFISGPVFLLSDILGGIANAPRTWFYEFSTDVRVGAKVLGLPLPEWERADMLTEYLATARQAGREPMFDTALGEFHRTAFGRGGLIVRWMIFLPFKLLVSPIFLDGMGRPAWDVMQHRAINTLHLADETEWNGDDANSKTLPAVLSREASGAFAQFLRRLSEHVDAEEQASGVCYEITAVGHSMGAMIWNDALHLFPSLALRDIVYMGAACSVQDAQRTLIPYLEAHPRTQFHNLTLHPIAEAEEVNWFELPSRGSLLEWIDNWYSRPTNVTSKRLGKWLVAIQTIHVFHGVRGQVHLKGFGREPGSKPAAHGEFNDCPFWRRKFRETSGPLIY